MIRGQRVTAHLCKGSRSCQTCNVLLSTDVVRGQKKGLPLCTRDERKKGGGGESLQILLSILSDTFHHSDRGGKEGMIVYIYV